MTDEHYSMGRHITEADFGFTIAVLFSTFVQKGSMKRG